MIREDPSEDDILAVIVEEVSQRIRRGERPSIADYQTRFPRLAARLEDLLPGLLLMGVAAAEPPTIASPLVGKLGDFRLLRAVGRGAMGTVYEAVQESLQRTVAVKVLHQTATSSQLKRFRLEAHVAGSLNHPHIVPVYGVGEADGRPYYVMRFVAGAGLNHILDLARQEKGQDPSGSLGLSPVPQPKRDWTAGAGHVRAVCGVIAQVADGVAHAHAMDVVHRDIKPANILIGDDGAAWVTDFGLAKLLDNNSQSVEVVGTLRYMAPERFRGINDPRCDVYALGVTLYEAVTLRPAFPQADRVALIAAVLSGRPPSPRAIEPSLPSDLETIILTAIARDPGDRYVTATEFAADLWAFLGNHPIMAYIPNRLERFVRRTRRRVAKFVRLKNK